MTPDSGPARTEESREQRTNDVSLLLLTIKEVFVYKVNSYLRVYQGQ